jgi:hypothetical protein
MDELDGSTRIVLSNATLSANEQYAALNVSAANIEWVGAEGCTFNGALQFFEWGLPAENGTLHSVYIDNSTFLEGSYIVQGSHHSDSSCGLNTTLRNNRWLPVAAGQSSFSTIRPLRCRLSGRGNYVVDARGNYWGDPLGPFSCCNPSSRGAAVTLTDASSWCIDEQCLSLSSPIVGNLTSYSPLLCQRDPFCTPVSFPLRYSAIAACVAISLFCGIVAAVIYKRISQSGAEARLLHSDTFVLVSRLSLILNASLIMCSTFTLAITAYTYVLYRNQHPWMLPALIFLAVVCGSRILCGIWSILIFGLFKGESNLFSNTVLSSVVAFFAVAWHFSAWSGTYFDGLSNSLFFWAVYGAYAVAEIVIGTSSIFLHTQFMLNREFKESTKHP